jgi:hypothetical protein
MFSKLPTLHHPKSKLLILGLLTINIALYAIFDSFLSAIDALAWVGLLVLYEFEAESLPIKISKKTREYLRNFLIALVVLVFISFLQNQAWLDVINALLWFSLIIMLELEIRHPDKVTPHQAKFSLITQLVFLGLILVVALWLWDHAWLDAYDASLWVAAFALIEVDIFHFLKLPRV